MGNRAGSLQAVRYRCHNRSRSADSTTSFIATSPSHRWSSEFLSSGESLYEVDESNCPAAAAVAGAEDKRQRQTAKEPVAPGRRRTRARTLVASDGAEFQVTPLPITFRWEGSSETCSVFLCGSFSDWQPLRMERNGEGDFTLMVGLSEGCHQYRYLVNGAWKHDPASPTIQANALHPCSNIIEVRSQDFRVFDALALDNLKLLDNLPQSSCADSDDEYGQNQPRRYPRGRQGEEEEQPPTIPRYLMELNLNKCTSGIQGNAVAKLSELPEPSHVMLKHLYSLSLRDGVMVVGTSVRFRQKKISTIYYKALQTN